MFGSVKRKQPAGNGFGQPKPSNPFEQLARKKLKTNHAAGSLRSPSMVATSMGKTALADSVPGRANQAGAKKSKKKKGKQVTSSTDRSVGAAAIDISAVGIQKLGGAAQAAHIEPLSTTRLVDSDQRFVYVGPLLSTDPAPLLKLFQPLNTGPVSICMLHDWSSHDGPFLGVASVEFPTASDLKRALVSALDLRGKDGKILLSKTNGMASAVAINIGHSCSALRAAGVNLLKAQERAKQSKIGLTLQQLDDHTLEMVGACCKGVADAALDELIGISGTKTSKMLRQILRRLQQRAAVGRAPHSFLWRGEVTGLPLPLEPLRHMRNILDALDWKAMGNNRNPTGQGKINVENSFSLGMATHKFSSAGPFSTPFAFRPGLGVWDGASMKKKHKEVWDAAWAMLRSVDPDFHCTSIGFNKNFIGSPHRDDKDCGPQVATALGEYTGGRLRVYSQSGAIDVDTRNRWCRFDGRYEHEVLPFSGTRYSVIFYQLEPSFAVDLTTTIEGSAQRSSH